MHNQIHQFNDVREYFRMLKGIGEMAMAFSITWMLERDWATLLVGINFGLKPTIENTIEFEAMDDNAY